MHINFKKTLINKLNISGKDMIFISNKFLKVHRIDCSIVVLKELNHDNNRCKFIIRLVNYLNYCLRYILINFHILGLQEDRETNYA